ncbi:hypothetical protein L227DRAFT_286065 [Lentinus tigrinus ALCF2SS1-6]|uniref:F-box domain-containing protein n=1 Tax=Lentinus tigrinus ALCF2SS1-6 TaxID=1328759 RepID=A0A5C2RYD4_9APHY|nr:hypothetical protein L227DRAFT_286065 [Lentinus tigrinus ALCF2SS1-6]
MSARGSIPSDDVLRIIFEQLELPAASTYSSIPGEPAESQRTLARSACVCKAFYGHAVRILWRDLFPLFSLLSSFAKVAEDRYTGVATYMVTGNVPRLEWDRLAFYASFVTTLGDRGSGYPRSGGYRPLRGFTSDVLHHTSHFCHTYKRSFGDGPQLIVQPCCTSFPPLLPTSPSLRRSTTHTATGQSTNRNEKRPSG